MNGSRVTPKVRALVLGVAFSIGLTFTATAHAGELKFGEGPSSLVTDDDGKLTAEGRKSALKELDRVPGEDAWDLRIWVKVDRGDEGPLYVEFFQKINGKEHIAYRHEISDYDGGKYVSENILLEGNVGFNNGVTYRVAVIQNDGKRDIKLAEGRLKLIDTGRKPEEGSDEGEEAVEDDGVSQDELDGLSGPDEEEAPAEATPPPTTSPTEKRGCRIADEHNYGGSALMLLALVGLRARRRRVQP